MHTWRFRIWTLWLSMQYLICNLRAEEQTKWQSTQHHQVHPKEFNTTTSDGPIELWSTNMSLISDKVLLFTWVNNTFIDDEIKHFELKATTVMDEWDVNHVKEINANHRLGLLGDLLPGRIYNASFIVVYDNWQYEVHTGIHRTQSQAPSEVRNLRVERVTSNSLNITWDRPLQTGGELDGYLLNIQYKKALSPEVHLKEHLNSSSTHIFIDNLPDDCEVQLQIRASTRPHIPKSTSIVGRHAILRLKTLADPAHLNWTFNIEPVSGSSLQFEWSSPSVRANELQRLELKAMTAAYGVKRNYTKSINSTDGKGILKGLHPGTKYDTMIVAVYASEIIEMYTGIHRTKAHAPSRIMHFDFESVTSDAASFVWAPPAQPGGELDDYLMSITYNKSGNTLENLHRIGAWRTEYVAAGLPADCDIEVKIQARTQSHLAGEKSIEGTWSEVLRLKTLAVLDPAHLNWAVVVAPVNESTVQFKWSTPMVGRSNLRSIELKATTIVDEWKIDYRTDTQFAAGEGLIGGLLPGRTYETLLIAVYDNRRTQVYTGWYTTTCNASSPVRNIRKHAVTPNSISLRWKRPLYLGGYLTAYRLTLQYDRMYGSRFEASRLISPALTAYDIDGLPANQDIAIKMQAITRAANSSEGNLTGQWSATYHFKTSVDPLALPTSTQVLLINNTLLQFNWSNWTFQEDGLQQFELRAIDRTGEVPAIHSVNVSSSSRTGILEKLPVNRIYETEIVAVYDNWSLEKYTGWHTVPGGIPVHVVNVSGISWKGVTVVLEELEEPGHNFVKVVDMEDPKFSTVLVTASFRERITLVNMQSDRNYTIAIARSSSITDPNDENLQQYFSAPIFIRTWPGPPSEPTKVTGSRFNATSVRVTWGKPRYSRGNLTGYKVEYSYGTLNGTVQNSLLQMDPNLYQADIHNLPSGAQVGIKVAGHTLPSAEGHGGGWGVSSFWFTISGSTITTSRRPRASKSTPKPVITTSTSVNPAPNSVIPVLFVLVLVVTFYM